MKKTFEQQVLHVEWECRVWLEDRRNWPNFDQYLGSRITINIQHFEVPEADWPKFIAACNEKCKYIGEAFPLGDESHNERIRANS